MSLTQFLRRTNLSSLPYDFFKHVVRPFGTLPEDVSYLHQPGQETLVNMTYGQLIDRAGELFGDRIFIQSEHQLIKCTYREVSEKTDKLAAGLLALGLQPGDRIGIFGTNSLEWAISSLATSKAGLISVNINPSSQIPELKHCLKTVDVKALMIDEKLKFQNPIEMVQTIQKERVNIGGNILDPVIVFSDEKYPGMLRLSDVANSATDKSKSQMQFLKNAIQSDQGCNIQFTSGTTGAPKGCLLSHHGMINNAITNSRRSNLNPLEDSISLNVPLFHCYGFVVGLTHAIYKGIRVVFPSPTFSAQKTIEAIQKERLTTVFGTPTMYVDLLDNLKSSGQKLDSLKYAFTAGSLCSPQLFNQIMSTLNLKNVRTCYGMTETSPVSFSTTDDLSWNENITSVGRIMDNLEAKIVDIEGKIVPFGTPGELLVRGYSTMLEYWNNESATKAIIGPDRWIKTGDQFVLRKDGVGKLVGRVKDMIIRGGENIFPKEIEEFLETHPDISEAQVFGVPDRRLGEKICATIRIQKNTNLKVEDIKNYCKGKISHFKIPQHIQIKHEFPKTLSGKIKKFELKKEMEESLSLNNI